jgi:glycosyltransferase involved in cell wall biosynthesis
MQQGLEHSILLVGNFLHGHIGVRGVCEELAERLRGAGWNVLTTSSRLAKLPRMADMVQTAWRARNRYRIAQVDVYSGGAFAWAEAVCFTLRRAGKPYILTLHGGALPEFAQANPGRMRRLLGSARSVTAPSNYLLERLRPYRADIQLVPNALDLSRYPYRKRLEAQPRIVWLRAFHEIYNPMLAVRALGLLVEEFPELRLLMVGPDKQDGSLERTRELAAKMGLLSRIEFAGRVPKEEIGKWMDRGDIFLNTTTIDNTPVTVWEAMACGLSIVCTKVGGLPYMLRDGEDALLAPSNDAEAMASAVARILYEPELAARLSRQARLRAEQVDWAPVLAQWNELLKEAPESRTLMEERLLA